jgi:hypothetical protein
MNVGIKGIKNLKIGDKVLVQQDGFHEAVVIDISENKAYIKVTYRKLFGYKTEWIDDYRLRDRLNV